MRPPNGRGFKLAWLSQTSAFPFSSSEYRQSGQDLAHGLQVGGGALILFSSVKTDCTDWALI